jgi:hypothetical protein
MRVTVFGAGREWPAPDEPALYHYLAAVQAETVALGVV